MKKSNWTQIGGDMNPGSYGATLAKCNGSAIEILILQPTIEYVGESEALEVGFPFWTSEGYFDESDLRPERDEVISALKCCGIDLDEVELEHQPMAIAEALSSYGSCMEPGPSGFASDVIRERVKWWASKQPRGWRFLADEDQEFRRLQREKSV